MAQYLLKCAECGHIEPETSYVVGCPKCGGFIEVELTNKPSPNAFVDDRYRSIFKYHRAMPYDPTAEDLASLETIEETPEFLSEPLSEAIGAEIYLKNEMEMPSGTWKDREGFVSIHRLLKSGLKDMVIFSSGNTGTSLARSASLFKGPRLHIVVPRASEGRVKTYKEFFDERFVQIHPFDGSNDECADYAGRLAKERGWASEGGFANYARREGLKLLGLEYIAGKTPRVHWYAQPVAGGIGVYSFEKAHRDVGLGAECPRILGVQADICAPMVNAWLDGSATLEERHIPQDVVPSDFVRVLRTRKPKGSYPVLKKIMDRVNGAFNAVSDREIFDGLRLFYKDPGIREFTKRTGRHVGLEPATVLAGVAKAVREGTIKKGERVLVNVSGAAKTGDLKPEWVADVV